MKLEITDLNNGSVFTGDKLNIRTKFLFEEDTSILWSGVGLITNPPCMKELQIAKQEVFSRGNFEAGEYIRERGILIKSNAVPTIEKRNLLYRLILLLRQVNPINPDDDIIVKKPHDIKINAKESRVRPVSQNPISFSISGLNINLTKDIYRPGETIKINYSSEDLNKIEIRLLQEANIVCYCEAYGQNCRQVEELPPAIAGDVKTTNTEEGFMLLKVPEIAEPSHDYLYAPSEKEYWGFRYGDYTKWSLLVLGKKRTGRDVIKLEVPVTIAAKSPVSGREGIDLFVSGASTSPSVLELSSKFQKVVKVISIDSDLDNLERYKIKFKNTSKEDLKGATVKISGLQEGLFETAPFLTGFNIWKKDEEKEIVYETKQNISAIILILEDNSQRNIRIQTRI